jgi:hypothetical protein
MKLAKLLRNALQMQIDEAYYQLENGSETRAAVIFETVMATANAMGISNEQLEVEYELTFDHFSKVANYDEIKKMKERAVGPGEYELVAAFDLKEYKTTIQIFDNTENQKVKFEVAMIMDGSTLTETQEVDYGIEVDNNINQIAETIALVIAADGDSEVIQIYDDENWKNIITAAIEDATPQADAEWGE